MNKDVSFDGRRLISRSSQDEWGEVSSLNIKSVQTDAWSGLVLFWINAADTSGHAAWITGVCVCVCLKDSISPSQVLWLEL